MTAAEDLARRVQAARFAYERRAGQAEEIARAGKAAQARVDELEARHGVLQKATAVLTSLGEERQREDQEKIESLVTRGLQVIFGNELSFRMVQSVKANASVVEFVVVSQYGERVIETPVMDARGGGLAATVGFMLRLVVLLLTPGVRRTLVLDETFGHVSAEFEPRLAEFLREVCDKAGVQLILVTHSDAYNDVADVRYRIELGPGGASQVKQA